MFREKLKVGVIVMAALLLASCAPGLSKTMRVDRIPEGEAVAKGDRLEMQAKLDMVEDLRPKSYVARIDGREINAQGSVAQSVEDALKRESSRRGLNLNGASPRLQVQVLDWFVEITPAFPMTIVDSKAELRFSLVGHESEQLYVATYSGDFNVKHPFPTQAKVEEYLGSSMREAISAALSDNELMGAMYRVSR